MKRKDKEYVDQQIQWVREIKKTEIYWLEKYLEEGQKVQKESTRLDREAMETWKQGIVEKWDRIEEVLTELRSQGVTRREIRSLIITVVTILITFLGLLVAIFVKR